MTLSTLLALATTAALVIALPRLLVRHNHLAERVQQSPFCFALVAMSALGALGYFGLTEMAGRYGMAALLAFFTFSVVFLFAPLVLKPLQWAANNRRLPTLAGLFSFRYRGTRIGPLVGGILILSCLPFAAGQLRMAGETLLFSMNPATTSDTSLLMAITLFSLPIAAALWLFGGPDRNRVSHTLLVTLVVCSAIAQIALVVTAISTVQHSFGSLAEMQQWVNDQNQQQVVQRFERGYSLISLFLIASLTLPQLYHLQAQVRPSPHQWQQISWQLPLLLFIATLTMFPVLWSALNSELEVPLQFYLLAASAQQGEGMHFVSQLGALTSCAAALLLLAMTISQMAGHSRALAQYQAAPANHFYRRQQRRRRGAALCWLALAAIAAFTTQTNSITQLTLVSFIGVAQLIPGLLSALYVPALNRAGVAAGLLAGWSLWLLGLLIPLFIGEWQYRLTDSLTLYFGASHWSYWLLVSLAMNALVSLLVSRRVPRSKTEALYASASMVDDYTPPQRIELSACDMTKVEQLLAETLGSEAAAQELQQARIGLPDNPDDMRPQEWRALRDKLTANLYQLIGVFSTEQLIHNILPLTTSDDQRHKNLRSLEQLVAGRQHELIGIAAEVNKLRLHQQQLLQSLPVGACSIDQDGEIVLWNQTLASITNTPADSAVGGFLTQLPAPWQDILSTTAASEQANQHGVKVQQDSGPRWFNIHKTVVQHPSGSAQEQVILLEDVTSTVLLTDKIGHTERLASVGRFAAGVAHEIGNPVTGISCLAQDIQADPNHPDTPQSAQQILELTQRITQIVQSMVDFSRSGEEAQLTLQPVNLAATVQQALQLIHLDREASERHYDLQIADDLQVQAEPHQLVQVLLNIISNARDASAANSTISVDAEPDQPHTAIHITDQGSGIPADQLDKVLEPFFTTKQVGEGTGLGLWLVYNMVRNMGGDLQLQSPISDQGGTRITILLPSALDLPSTPSTI